VDAHSDAAHALLARFRFVPDARLDDLMISWASDGGGVGPHVDSYDVFLVQLAGRRRWRVGRVDDASPRPGLPLAILARFEPESEWTLEPGDLLYLPPGWGHDGIAEGECMTGSIGFRSSTAVGLADALLQRLADEEPAERADARRYGDPAQPAVAHPARVPERLQRFARAALRARLAQPGAVEHALGALLSEPNPDVRFAARGSGPAGVGVALDRATRMLYDAGSVYVNGERYAAAGADAGAMRRLADRRRLEAGVLARLSAEALAVIAEWRAAGWLHATDAGG
jgi:50S ribosomal protein L16 3-hydroxylase